MRPAVQKDAALHPVLAEGSHAAGNPQPSGGGVLSGHRASLLKARIFGRGACPCVRAAGWLLAHCGGGGAVTGWGAGSENPNFNDQKE